LNSAAYTIVAEGPGVTLQVKLDLQNILNINNRICCLKYEGRTKH